MDSQVVELETLRTAYSLREKGQLRQLQQALGDLKQDVRRDSREPHGAVMHWVQVQHLIKDGETDVIEVRSDVCRKEYVRNDRLHDARRSTH